MGIARIVRSGSTGIVALGWFALLTTGVALAAGGGTWRVSVDSAENEIPAPSYLPAISGSGAVVAFLSQGLVEGNVVHECTEECDFNPNDPNCFCFDQTWANVFVRDRSPGTTTLVSAAPDGTPGDAGSYYAAISYDARTVVYSSDATNIVPGDSNGAADVFAYDRVTGTNTRVSVSSSGAEANGPSLYLAVSGNGRYVAFTSAANNLAANDLNPNFDTFVHDRVTGATTLVSTDPFGGPQNGYSLGVSISANGRYVAYDSTADNLAPNAPFGGVFVKDLVTGVTECVSVDSAGNPGDGFGPSISADGRVVAFSAYSGELDPSDTNGATDVYVHDRATGVTKRVSLDSNGGQALAASQSANVSANGRFVAFTSYWTLVPADTNNDADVYVYDLQTSTISRPSVSSAGNEAGGGSYADYGALSGNGKHIVFDSVANGLVAGDLNAASDVFVRDEP